MMLKNFRTLGVLLILSACFSITAVYAQEYTEQETTEKIFGQSNHIFENGVSAIAESFYDYTVFAAGNDGFITAYSYPQWEAASFQISRLPLKLLAAHPKKDYVAVYETDGFGVHRVSVWKWAAKKEMFSRSFPSAVLSLSWSAKGRYIFIGTASMEGITVLDVHGKQKEIYETPPGIVLLAATGMSEKTIVTYGETGRLVYANIAKRSIVTQYETESYLKNPELIKNYTRITGYKDGNVVVIKAASGEVLNTYPARAAIFAGRLEDEEPVWIEPAEKKHTWYVCKGEKKSQAFDIPDRAKITAARRSAAGIFVGTANGNVYQIKQTQDDSVMLTALTAPSTEKITDICATDSSLYLLTAKNLYTASLEEPSAAVHFANNGAANCIPYDQGFLLWTKDRRMPLYYAEKERKPKILYSAKEAVNSVSVYGETIAIVHPFSGFVLINGKTGKKIFAYKAAGLQEAVQIDDMFVLISKSAADTTGRPLFLINLKTQETIPLDLAGALAFSLNTCRENPYTFSCMRIITDEVPKTQLVSMTINLEHPEQSSFTTLDSYNAEDLQVFVHEEKENLITNLGQGSLAVYNKKSRKQQQFKREYALPYKAVSLGKYVIALNYDGSLSWFKRNGEPILTTQLNLTE